MHCVKQVTIEDVAWELILNHVRETLGQEACGVLLGGKLREGWVVSWAVACHNVAPDPQQQFICCAEGMKEADRLAQQFGLVVIGCYHSHPKDAPSPSGLDVEWLPVGHIGLLVQTDGSCETYEPSYDRPEPIPEVSGI